jgi:sec-independent protein translocase protein TatA
MFGIGTTELIIIMFIILLVFGSKKLPELAQGLGKGIREFKRASSEIQDELNVNPSENPSKPKVRSTESESSDTDETKKDN